MKHALDFEKPIVELREKIEELKSYTADNNVDMTEDIEKLEKRLERLENDIYNNLKPWQRVQIARHQKRPTTQDYIDELFTNFVEFHGDRLYGDDEAIVTGIALFHDIPVTIIGHQRGRDTKENIRRNFGMPHPEGYRKALRHMYQAEKFNRPIITFIDTKGAYPGKASEERGQSEAIARNLMEMSGLKVPIISTVIGEGGSGGALGIGIGDRIHMLENSTYSVISPEGAAALLWKDASKSQQAAETMQITSYDLKNLDIIDNIIPEPQGGAHWDIKTQAASVDTALYQSVKELQELTTDKLLEQRQTKYRQMGEFQS